MSYSFNVTGTTPGEVTNKIAAELDAIVAAQEVHALDRPAVEQAAEAFVLSLEAPEAGTAYSVTVSGTATKDGEGGLRIVGVNISARSINII